MIQNRLKKGFTLIEMLVVIVIIGVLITWAITATGAGEIKPDKVKSQVKTAGGNFQNAVNNYNASNPPSSSSFKDNTTGFLKPKNIVEKVFYGDSSPSEIKFDQVIKNCENFIENNQQYAGLKSICSSIENQGILQSKANSVKIIGLEKGKGLNNITSNHNVISIAGKEKTSNKQSLGIAILFKLSNPRIIEGNDYKTAVVGFDKQGDYIWGITDTEISSFSH